MTLVESPLNPQQTFAQAADHMSRKRRFGGRGGLGARLFDGNRDFIFQLNAVAQTIVDIEIRYLVFAGRGISFANPTKVNLPVPVARGLGIVRSKWRSALRSSRGKQQEGHDEGKSTNPVSALETPLLFSRRATRVKTSQVHQHDDKYDTLNLAEGFWIALGANEVFASQPLD